MVSLAVSVSLFLVGLLALLLAADRFTDAAEKVGLSLGFSPFIVGMTIVAAGTSFPELVAATLASIQNVPGIVVGNVVGANLANIFLILGISAVVGHDLRVNRELMRVDLPLLVGSAFFLLVAVWDSPFTRLEGLLALAALVVYFHFTVSEKDDVVGDVVEDLEAIDVERVGTRTYLVLVGSLVVVFLAAQGVVTAITDLAGLLGVGPELIAITVLSVGTTLPELSVTVVAARRGYAELAVGNILGSNIFNALAVMGLPSLFGPLTVAESIRGYALPVMVLGTLLYFFITQDRQITRWEGGTLLLLYALFLVNLGGFV